jgi:Zn-finger nucleic acid-binding protein
MHCPLCKTDTMQRTTLEMDIPAYQCSTCAGIWISSNEYLRWDRAHGQDLAEKSADDSSVPTWDTKELKLCPECGHILTHYRVLPNVRFYLDHCRHCNNVWFDRNEWEVLVARNLHDKVNDLFTQPWQIRVRQEEAHAMLDKLYLEKFGAQDYDRIQEIWSWLKPHPQRAMLLAYLQANDPYRL